MTTALPKWRFESQRGYFSHDDDIESWDFRATTRPKLGIIDRWYPTDAEFDPDHRKSEWQRLQEYVKSLNAQDPESKRWKVFYLVRHGEGIHNVKEKEYGREEWDRHFSRLSGDATATWLDAALTQRGEQQARAIATFFATSRLPAPGSVYSSPLRRCLHTTTLAFPRVAENASATPPMVRENLRERLGVHTCDRRSSRTWIAKQYPEFRFEEGFAEDDELWGAERRETLEQHVRRSAVLLGDIFARDGSEVVALTAHSGAIMALFGVVRWRKIPVAVGAVYPLLVSATRIQEQG
ncbi:putative phosphoglycerate mutase pmu1 [Coniothyrium glycines]